MRATRKEAKDTSHVLHTETGWEIMHHRTVPCYYEGDLNVSDSSMAGGHGGFYVSKEAR